MFYGWWVVACTFLIAVWGWGLGFYGLSVYLVALQKQNGWSASTISFAIAVYYLIGAALMAMLSDAIRKLGPRRAVLGGICCMGAGAVAVTYVTAIWQLYAAFAVMALGWATMSSACINILLAPWFERRRGIAVSLAMTGATCGGMIVAPLLIPLIEAAGFRLGVGLAVAAMLSMLLPFAAIVLRHTPAGLGVGPDGAAPAPQAVASLKASGNAQAYRREAFRTREYWTLSIGFALALSAQVGLLTHFVALIAPQYGKPVAALALSIATLTALVARFAVGGIVDRYDRRIVAACVFLVQAAGVGLLMHATSPVALYAGCVLFGSGVGNVTTLPGLLVHKEFRVEQFAAVVSLVIATNQVTYAFAPSVLGLLRDATGNYQAALMLVITFQLAAIAVVLLGRRRKPDAMRNVTQSTASSSQSTSAASTRTQGDAMLQLRPNCECCDRDLPPDSRDAVICSFECTFCQTCADTLLRGRCPNCGGELVRRPVRPAAALAKHPASKERVTRQTPCAPAA